MTVEVRAKKRGWENGKKRGPQTAEHRAKISAANLGKKRGPPTAESCAKMSRAKLGKRLTDTHRANIAAGLRRQREREETP